MRVRLLIIISTSLFYVQSAFTNSEEKPDSLLLLVNQILYSHEYTWTKDQTDSICVAADLEKNPKFIFICHYLNGELYTKDRHKALRHFFKSIEVLKENPNIDAKYYVLAYLGVKMVYSDIQDYRQALKYAKLAVKYSKQNENYQLLNALDQLSITYRQLKDTANALKLQEEIISNYDDNTPYPDIVLSKYDYFFLKNNLDSIVHYAWKFLEIESGNYGTEVEVSFNTAELLLERNDTLGCIPLYEHAISSSQRINYHKAIHLGSAKLRDIYLSKNQMQEANYFQVLAARHKDSLIAYSSVNEINNIELEQEKSKWNKKFIYLLIVISITFLVAILMFYLFKGKSFTKPINTEGKIQLNSNQLEEVEQNMQLFFNEKLFLQPGKTMKNIVQDLEIKNERYLRYYIKKTYTKGFNDFINDLRIEHMVERLINDKMFRNYSLDQIALESGFSSRQVMSRLFKKKMKISVFNFIKSIE